MSSSRQRNMPPPPTGGPDALRHRTAQPREAATTSTSSEIHEADDDGHINPPPEAAEERPSSPSAAEKRLERFMEYSKRALLYEFPLATSLLQHWTASFAGSAWAKAGIALLCAALFADLMGSIYLALVTMLDADVTDSTCRWHGVRIYASAVLLMSMPFWLLMSLNVLYAFLAVALAPLLYLVFLLFANEHRRLRLRRRSKLKHQFDASAAVNTIATGAGLMGAFNGYSTRFSPDHAVTDSESLLFLTIVGGQFVMLVTAARPIFRRESSPARFAGFLGLLVGSLPVLLSLSAFAGAVDFLGGIALLAFSIDFLELVFFFRATFYAEQPDTPLLPYSDPRRAAPATGSRGEMENGGLQLQLLWLCVMYVCFTALYQEKAPVKAKLEWLERGRVLVYFWAFCCCSLDGGKGKLPPLDELRRQQHHWSLGLARSLVMGVAALDGLWRPVFTGTFLIPIWGSQSAT
uniref:Uncharacterized protein n=1 Tax=Leersia perrieri TaxID=77586 RepID=A0A0D9WI40_9ORYZ